MPRLYFAEDVLINQDIFNNCANNKFMIRRFFIYGILGWLMEVLYTGLLSALEGNWRLTSTTYLWMFPIYGMAILLEPLHNTVREKPWLFRGFLWVAAIWFLEAGSGFLIKIITGSIPWDYTGHSPFQIGGLIRLDMAPLWFGVGFIFERVHDYLVRLTEKSYI